MPKAKAKAKAKEPEVLEPKELTPWEAMDLADEVQIIDELEGKLTPEDIETFVYSFPDKQTGRTITGLSWRGVKATWWAFNKEKFTDMTITDQVRITQGDGHVDVAVYAFDKKRGIGAWGMARGYDKMSTKSGEVVDKFASAKAMSKAQRNALSHLFPSKLVAKMIAQWIKKGNVKTLDSGEVSKVQSRVAGSSRQQFVSQEALMEKYGMDTKQVSPKCPSCESVMKIVERKDGSGIFWSCPNWRSKGCKGCNIDDVDMDGSFITKEKKSKKEDEKLEQIDEDLASAERDMPF